MPGKSPPYIPWWVNDYITGSQHLSPEGRYVYSELLWSQWSLGGRLPTCIRQLRRLARAESWSMQKFKKVWAEVQADDQGVYSAKFQQDDEGFFNPRLSAELEKVTARTDQLADLAKKKNLKRWGCPACREAGSPMAPNTLTGNEEKCSRCNHQF